MAFDPRLSLINFNTLFNTSPTPQTQGQCSTIRSQNLTGSTLLNEFQNNIGAANVLGEFQMLPSGGGAVGAGLASLVALSEQIRIGGSPSTVNAYGLPTSPENGIEYVLNKVGLSGQTIAGLVSVNGLVANAATLAAANVYNHVQQGTFTAQQLQESFSAFQNASALSNTIFHAVDALSPKASEFGAMCGAKPYAMDLIAMAPKYKFLFVVQFEFNPEFNEVLASIDPAFVVKNSSRPQIRFDYEDVNMYNFRTKVPRKTIYEPMTMKFYDDDYNNAFQLYATYLKVMSPIANIDVEGAKIDPLDAYDIAGGGMGFNQQTQHIQTGWSKTLGQGYAASLGPFGSNQKVRNVFRRISLFQVYKQGRMMNVYHFYNPKFTQMQLDDLDMATTADGCEVELTFTYDSVFIIPGYRVLENNYDYNLYDMTDAGKYPFGTQPNTISNDGNPKDGTGRGGINYGQNNVLLNDSTHAPAVTAGSTLTNFNLQPITATSLNNTSLVNMPTIPNPGGGSNTNATAQPTLPTITITANRITDPLTGNTVQSADNSGNLGSVFGETMNNITQATTTSQLAASNATTLSDLVTANNTTLSQISAASSSLESTQSVFTNNNTNNTTPDPLGGPI